MPNIDLDDKMSLELARDNFSQESVDYWLAHGLDIPLCTECYINLGFEKTNPGGPEHPPYEDFDDICENCGIKLTDDDD